MVDFVWSHRERETIDRQQMQIPFLSVRLFVIYFLSSTRLGEFWVQHLCVNVCMSIIKPKKNEIGNSVHSIVRFTKIRQKLSTAAC